MKSKLFRTIVLIFGGVISLAPLAVFAAYNDVTLTTDAVISVGAYSLNVSGSSAAIQSIRVNASNFSVTLASGSSIVVSSPSLQQLSSDVTSDIANNTCTGSASSISLAYSGAGTVTNTITPSATLCTTLASSGGSSGGGGNGPIAGSYGGSGGSVAAPAINVSVAASATSSASTMPTQPSLAASSTSTYIFSKNLRLGMTNADVVKLQQFLNESGFLIAKSGAGSQGNETAYFGRLTYNALVKFQEAHVTAILAPSGLTKGTGYFGPSTRAFINK